MRLPVAVLTNARSPPRPTCGSPWLLPELNRPRPVPLTTATMRFPSLLDVVVPAPSRGRFRIDGCNIQRSGYWFRASLTVLVTLRRAPELRRQPRVATTGHARDLYRRFQPPIMGLHRPG